MRSRAARVVALSLRLPSLCLCACGSPAAPAAQPPPAPFVRENLPDADAELERRIREVVVAESARLRACYEQGLEKNPELAGKVILVLEVGQSGTATRVFEARREGLGDAEVKCFAGVLKTAHFHDGAARAVRIQVPLAFAKRDAAGS